MPERGQQVMKMIKITTGNQISVHDFPDGSISEQTKLLCKYIGPECQNDYIQNSMLLVKEEIA